PGTTRGVERRMRRRIAALAGSPTGNEDNPFRPPFAQRPVRWDFGNLKRRCKRSGTSREVRAFTDTPAPKSGLLLAQMAALTTRKAAGSADALSGQADAAGRNALSSTARRPGPRLLAAADPRGPRR